MFHLHLALFMIVFYLCTVAKYCIFSLSLSFMCFSQLKRNLQKKKQVEYI